MLSLLLLAWLSGVTGLAGPAANEYTLGFHSPIRCPRSESMTAVDPLNWGATKLVPPQPACSTGLPTPANDGSYSREPEDGAASADRAGAARAGGPPPSR